MHEQLKDRNSGEDRHSDPAAAKPRITSTGVDIDIGSATNGADVHDKGFTS